MVTWREKGGDPKLLLLLPKRKKKEDACLALIRFLTNLNKKFGKS
jgi:hypothetical protein